MEYSHRVYCRQYSVEEAHRIACITTEQHLRDLMDSEAFQAYQRLKNKRAFWSGLWRRTSFCIVFVLLVLGFATFITKDQTPTKDRPFNAAFLLRQPTVDTAMMTTTTTAAAAPIEPPPAALHPAVITAVTTMAEPPMHSDDDDSTIITTAGAKYFSTRWQPLTESMTESITYSVHNNVTANMTTVIECINKPHIISNPAVCAAAAVSRDEPAAAAVQQSPKSTTEGSRPSADDVYSVITTKNNQTCQGMKAAALNNYFMAALLVRSKETTVCTAVPAREPSAAHQGTMTTDVMIDVDLPVDNRTTIITANQGNSTHHQAHGQAFNNHFRLHRRTVRVRLHKHLRARSSSRTAAAGRRRITVRRRGGLSS
ncbi:hypothetical protein Vafri_20479 [Volvox africanus]|uniref:Uncharacterized protein n=1 Tax=Volvox africanus TaxID=51714 RepID=A0A8J4BX04_9CHLO|nr:hypothetical protein Vafri_20479 [Volvox africanus]